MGMADLPCLVHFIGAAFVFNTMFVCRKSNRPLWKNSILPLLYYGLEYRNFNSDTKDFGIDTAEKISTMEMLAKEMGLALRRDTVDKELRFERS
jgi:hypothetical protein